MLKVFSFCFLQANNGTGGFSNFIREGQPFLIRVNASDIPAQDVT